MTFAIHQHWEESFGVFHEWYRIRDHFDLINGFPFKSENFNTDGIGKPLVRIRDLLSDSLPTFFNGDEGTDIVVKNGDIVIGMDGDFNSVTWTKGEALLNQRVCALRAKNHSGVDPRILGYQIPISLKIINDLTPWSTVKHLSSFDVLSLRFPNFDPTIQRQIADFLDRETARISLLIEKKQRLVKLLDVKRRNAIRDLVTGADISEYPYRKPSNSPWFRDLPSHWQDAPVKRFAKIESGHTPSRSVPEYWEDASIKWVSLADSKQLRKIDFIAETTHQISLQGLAGSSARILPAGTVIFTRDATVGLAAIVASEMAVSQHLVGWICGPELFNEYLLYVFYAMEDELNRLTWGATIKTIGMPDLRALRTCLPPLPEQREIVRRIRAMSKNVNETSTRLETSIDRIKEYRSALITAAVTGQIDVSVHTKSGSTDRHLDAIQEEISA